MVTEKKSFTDRLRLWFKWVTDPLAAFFNRLGIHPNTMTIVGVLGTSIGAWMVALGHMTWGGFFILVSVPFDALDGTMARLRGEATNWGAFVDSVADRYSELITFAGLLFYFLIHKNILAGMLVFFSAAGSFLVSYVKAKGESLGFKVKGGLLTRAERYLVLAPLLVFNQPLIAVWLLAVLTNFTALQRIFIVRREVYKELNQPAGE